MERRPDARYDRVKPYRFTLRLTFRYAGEHIELAASRRAEMIAPPAVGPLPKAGASGGFWLELRDANGAVLFHRLLHDPLRTAVEVHEPDGIRLVTGPPGSGEFEALVPDVPDAAAIVLFGSLPRNEPARELARFALPSEGR